MAQITYYIYAYNKVKKETGSSNISFSIPTGNFGMLTQDILPRKSSIFLLRN